MAHVFLGITLVGIIMTIKIIFDGLNTVRVLREKIMAMRGSIVMGQNNIRKVKALSEDLAGEVDAEEERVAELLKRETELGEQIRELNAELDRDHYY